MASAPESELATGFARTVARAAVPAHAPLAALEPGREAVIVAVEDGPAGQRLRDLGLVRGTRIRALTRAPLGDPTLYELRGYRLCLRRNEAQRVQVSPA